MCHSFLHAHSPSSLDAVAFGAVSEVAWFVPALLEPHHTLRAFCDRVRATYFPPDVLLRTHPNVFMAARGEAYSPPGARATAARAAAAAAVLQQASDD